MKYLIALVLGVVAGGAIALGFLYLNPFTAQAALSPLSVSSKAQLSLNYSVAAEDAILFTNDGESQVKPFPGKVLQLWEPAIRQTDARVTVLKDSRGESIGLGIKYSSRSENTRLLNGEALVDSVWHIYLPEKGTFLIGQTENYWGFLRQIVVPAYWSSGDNWKGRWLGTMTSGPGALGTAVVYGASGVFKTIQAEAVEMLSAKAYSTEVGPVAIDGQLIVELPDRSDALVTDAIRQ
jgi:hypothetical protein